MKGQVTGPVSFGLMVCDREKKPIFYDPVGRDVLVKYLLRAAQWQAASLSRLSETLNRCIACHGVYQLAVAPAR